MATEVFFLRELHRDLATEGVAASQGHALGQFPEHEALEEILEGERCCSYCRHTYSAYFQMFQGEYSQAPTTTSHTRVTGMKIFQPRRMIWS